MIVDWSLAAWFFFTSCGGFLVGTRWAYTRIGLRIQKAIDEGSVLPWHGKAYVVSPVPHRPDFPAGIHRRGQGPTQTGNPTGV